MKPGKITALLLAACMALSLTACGGAAASDQAAASPGAAARPESAAQGEPASPGEAGEGEIIVFAAASMTETVTALKAAYEAAHPGITITCNFDSSGTLKTQIEEGGHL